MSKRTVGRSYHTSWRGVRKRQEYGNPWPYRALAGLTALTLFFGRDTYAYPSVEPTKGPAQQGNGHTLGQGTLGVIPTEIEVYPGFNLWTRCMEWHKNRYIDPERNMPPELNPIENCYDVHIRENSGLTDALGRPVVETPSLVRSEIADGVKARIRSIPITPFGP